nr:hypothetical protein [uncultured Oscillibacter sp.]
MSAGGKEAALKVEEYKKGCAEPVGSLLEKYPDLELLDYGFVYHGDRVFPGDDLTWFYTKKV